VRFGKRALGHKPLAAGRCGRLLVAWLPLLWSCGSAHPSSAQTSANPFAFLYPIVFTEEARRQLDQGQTVARILPHENDEIGVLIAIALEATGDVLRARMHDIEELKKSPRVLAIRRFSSPPSLEDLSGLALDDSDLEAIQACRPGDCKVKLSAREIEELHRALATAPADWSEALQRAFRRIVLQRVLTYLEGGLEALPPYHVFDDPVSLKSAFASIVLKLPSCTEELRGSPLTWSTTRRSRFQRWSPSCTGRKSRLDERRASR